MALHRSRNDKVIAGVCGGLAKWLGWNSTTVRVLYVLGLDTLRGFPRHDRLHRAVDPDASVRLAAPAF